MSEDARCELCGREVDRRTKHHLIPRTRHPNKKNRKTFTREEVRNRVAWLCRPCHSHVHATLTEKELERRFNTLEALASHPAIVRFVLWIRDKPASLRIRTRRARGRGEAPAPEP